jgi:hypothetical protein
MTELPWDPAAAAFDDEYGEREWNAVRGRANADDFCSDARALRFGTRVVLAERAADVRGHFRHRARINTSYAKRIDY